MIEQLNDNLVRISAMSVNCYLLIDRDQLVLIDAGLSLMSGEIKKAVATCSTVDRKLSTVLITHADPDHYGAISALRDTFGPVSVRANAREIPAIEAGNSSRQLRPKGLEKIFYTAGGLLMKVKGISVTSSLQDHELLPYLGGIEVLPTPGHTPGHVSFFLAKQKILFCGDSIKVARNKLIPSDGANTWNEETARESYDAQLKLEPTLICGGHCLVRMNG